ncbi:hypothetical protein [Aquimarina megaterium]|uniref:hypothetical protein n=1 Tax=Aquimarina megaterium TaxID=1443666 RepID=UPI0004725C55|nr:hypothetical protein [Aquimarina megaterium]
MRLFKPAIIILLLGLVSTTYAQDKSNDATWEETIGFLRKYSDKLEDVKKIDDKYIMYIYNTSVTETVIDLNYLLEIEGYKKSQIGDGHYLTLVLTGNYCYTRSNLSGKWEKNGLNLRNNYFIIPIADKEWQVRFLKAFQHLAYLAIKRRENQRKTSGDKF